MLSSSEPPPSAPPAPRARWLEPAAVALALLVAAWLRATLARNFAFDLVEGEELLNLRLLRQVRAGLPVGDLAAYWYTGAGGNTGAGTLLLSIAYLPLALLGEPDAWTVRTMAVLWGLLGLLLLAALGRQLLGRGGAAAGAWGWALLPPAWLGLSSTAYGNYVEGATLGLAVLVVGVAFVRRPGWALGVAFGLLLGLTAWFTVAIWPLLLVALGFLWFVPRRHAAAAVACAALFAAPTLAGFAPEGGTPPVSADAVGDAVSEFLAQPSRWPAIAYGAWAGMPLLEFDEVDAGWAMALVLEAQHTWRGLLWVGAAALLALAALPRLPALRVPGDPPARVALIALLGAALASPVALAAVGVGPEYLELPHLYYWDPRRAAVVYPAWGLVTAVALHAAVRPGPLRGPRAVAVALLAGLCVSLQGAMATSLDPPPPPFRPLKYIPCPAAEPRDEQALCVGTLWEDQVPVLEALLDEPRWADVQVREAALRAFGAVDREAPDCGVQWGSVAADGPWAADAWFAFGASVALACSDPVGLCARAPSAELAARCDDGGAFAGRR